MENTQSDIDFIKTDLLPEMVHNRCFCDANSREFVEFDSASIHQSKSIKSNPTRGLYRAQVVLRFSGQPKTFFVIIKLLSIDYLDEDEAFGRFLNEEMFYNKMTNKWKLDIYPKCYVADMGRYGRPVVVLEDLEALGYRHLDFKLDEDHLNILLKAIAKFHGRGLEIKLNEFNIFREFYAKLITPNENNHNDDIVKSINKAFTDLKDNNLSTDLAKKWAEKSEKISLNLNSQDNKFITICHGSFNKDHWLFKYENNKPIDLKIIGWNEMRYNNIFIDLSIIFDKNISNKSSTKMLYEYFCALVVEYSGHSCEQLYRDFLLTYFYPSKIQSVESPENEIELFNLLNKLS